MHKLCGKLPPYRRTGGARKQVGAVSSEPGLGAGSAQPSFRFRLAVSSKLVLSLELVDRENGKTRGAVLGDVRRISR